MPWFRDGVEVGWRIRSGVWGNGYAPEAARGRAGIAFDELGLDEVISFTAVTNDKSRRVMEKIGLTRDPDADFDHPTVPEGSPLRPHVLYRITAAQTSQRDGPASRCDRRCCCCTGRTSTCSASASPTSTAPPRSPTTSRRTVRSPTEHGLRIEAHQTNHEGELIDLIHAARGRCAAIIINPGAFTHYAWAIHDALAAFDGPIVEVHISNPNAREPWRHTSVVAPVATGSIMGFGSRRLRPRRAASIAERLR